MMKYMSHGVPPWLKKPPYWGKPWLTWLTWLLIINLETCKLSRLNSLLEIGSTLNGRVLGRKELNTWQWLYTIHHLTSASWKFPSLLGARKILTNSTDSTSLIFGFKPQHHALDRSKQNCTQDSSLTNRRNLRSWSKQQRNRLWICHQDPDGPFHAKTLEWPQRLYDDVHGKNEPDDEDWVDAKNWKRWDFQFSKREPFMLKADWHLGMPWKTLAGKGAWSWLDMGL